MVMPRRTHTKSRDGCRECKRRKLKCDEIAPCCFNCRRHGITCSFGEGPTALPLENSVLPFPTNADQAAVLVHRDDTSCPTVSTTSLRAVLEQSTQVNSGLLDSFWRRDVELMHHYCTVTADSLAIRGDMRYVWRVVKPREAYEHDFIMRAILALAAVHKAYLVPSQRQVYLDLSAHHQVLASQRCRTLLTSITDDNWRPLYCFTTLFTIYCLCLPVRLGREQAPNYVANFLELMLAVRGIRATIHPYTRLIPGSEYAPSLYAIWPLELAEIAPNSRPPSLDFSPLPGDTFDALDRLRSFYQREHQCDKRGHYLEAVDGLETAVRLIANAGTHAEAGTVVFWPYILDESIIVDLRAFHPYSLVILAFYAVFFAALEKQFWYMRRWASGLIEDVERRLSSQPIVAAEMRWPRDKVQELLSLA